MSILGGVTCLNTWLGKAGEETALPPTSLDLQMLEQSRGPIPH